MKHTGKDIREAILIVIMDYEGYISQLSLELNVAKKLKQICSEGDRISKAWAAMSPKHTTLDI